MVHSILTHINDVILIFWELKSYSLSSVILIVNLNNKVKDI